MIVRIITPVSSFDLCRSTDGRKDHFSTDNMRVVSFELFCVYVSHWSDSIILNVIVVCVHAYRNIVIYIFKSLLWIVYRKWNVLNFNWKLSNVEKNLFRFLFIRFFGIFRDFPPLTCVRTVIYFLLRYNLVENFFAIALLAPWPFVLRGRILSSLLLFMKGFHF